VQKIPKIFWEVATAPPPARMAPQSNSLGNVWLWAWKQLGNMLSLLHLQHPHTPAAYDR